jgi:phage terminase large subunit-like protein
MGNSFAVQLADALESSWPAIARPNQLPPPGDWWQIWLLLAGRGFGKTRTLAEWVCEQVASGQVSRIALVAATAADARDVLVEGESGILAVAPPGCRPIYEPSKRRLTWPHGAIATTFSAEEPDRLRGPQHDAAVCDELASWSHPQTWDMLQFGLRLGRNPRCLVATTPRPTKLLRELLAREGRDVVVTRGSSYDNKANLAPAFFAQIVKKYEGTRLGRQELNAELLEDTPDALWTHGIIDASRVSHVPELTRIVVAIDPTVTSGEEADETGIVVVGRTKTVTVTSWRIAREGTSRSSGPRLPSRLTGRMAATGSWPKSTTAVRWSRPRSAWSNPTCHSPPFGRRAERRHVPNRCRLSMNRAASITSGCFRRSRSRRVSSRLILIAILLDIRRTASTLWSGPQRNYSSSR